MTGISTKYQSSTPESSLKCGPLQVVAQIHTVVMPPVSVDRLTQRGNVLLYCCLLKVTSLRTDCHCESSSLKYPQHYYRKEKWRRYHLTYGNPHFAVSNLGFWVFQRISRCSSGRHGTHAPLPQPPWLQFSYNGSNTQESTNSSEGLQGKITVNILFEWFCFWKHHHARLEVEYSMPQAILKRSDVLSRLHWRAGGGEGEG